MTEQLRKLELKARIGTSADFARRQAARYGAGHNITIQAAIHVLRLIDDYRSQFGG